MLKFVNDLSANVNVVEHKNFLQGGDTTYYKMQRNTLTMNNVIAEILKGRNHSSDGELLNSYALIKSTILKFLNNGYAVEVLDLGTLYPSIVKGTEKKKQHFIVGFTPSEEAKKAVESIKISSIQPESTSASITKIEDYNTGIVNSYFSGNSVVRIYGSKLKIQDDEPSTGKAGIFFAPVLEDGSYPQEMDKWIKIPQSNIRVNMPSSLIFKLPENIETDKDYVLILQTFASQHKGLVKNMRKYEHKTPIHVR